MASGHFFSVGTDASTGPELDGLLATIDDIGLRRPYQFDPLAPAKINPDVME